MLVAFLVRGVVLVLLARTLLDLNNYTDYREDDGFEMVLTLGTTFLIFYFWVMSMGGLHGLRVSSRKVGSGHNIDMTGNQWF